MDDFTVLRNKYDRYDISYEDMRSWYNGYNLIQIMHIYIFLEKFTNRAPVKIGEGRNLSYLCEL